MLKSCQLDACPSGTLGLHLSRAPWDPYPWVSGVQDGSSAHRAGLQNGDTVLELNGRDVLGQKIAQIAEYIGEHWKSGATHVTVVVWRNQAAAVTANSDDDEEQRLENEARNKQHRQQQQQQQSINQLSLQKFATCLQHIAQLLECPVCLEVIRPPGWQCCNGHVVCNNCRSRSVKCPVCRVPLGPRGRCLLADKLFTLLAESFPCEREEKDADKEDEEEGDKQLEAYKIQQRCHSAGKQENEIILEQQRGFERVEEGVPEMEHLLSGQRELQQKQRQQQLLSQQSARVNTDVASVASTVDEDVLQREEHSQRSSGTMKQQQHNNNSNSNSNSNSINDDSNRNNNRKSNINSSNNNNNNTASHAQLDIQKFPPEMQYEDQRRPATERQQQQQQQQPEYRTTIITTAPSLNATTTSKPAALGGGGGGAVAVDAVSRASSEFKGPKIWRHLVQLWPIISQPLAIFCVFLMLWTLGFVLLPDYAVPSAAIMRIAFLFVGAQVSGILVTFLRLPDMLGMLFFGVLYTNVGLADFTGYQPLEAFLREMALINIMLLAGLGLDWKACKKLWFMILRLALVPTLAEVATVAVLSRFLLNMPWLWGILLGLVITAVSPNVVVTVMLKLKEDRLGLNSGIHTLIYAMTTCNDVVAIFVFGVILGVIFSTGTLTDQILQGPIGIGIGVVFGYVYGSMLHFIPSKKALYVDGLRFVLTVLGGTVSVMGSKAIGYPSAGALGCVTVAFIAGIGWKREQQKHLKQQQEQQQQQQQQQVQEAPYQQQQQQRAADDNTSVAKRLDLLWKFLKPVSFALIGKEINFTVLDGTVVGYGLLLVLLGSLVRLLFAYVSTLGGSLSRKERAYITISGFPKATVQAALGPVALDLARSLNADAEIISLANNVLIISVVAIICTAPIGAILMLRFAPLWLKHSQPCTSTEEQDDPRNASLDLRNDGHVMDSFNYQSSNKSQHFNHDPAGDATRTNHHVAGI